MAAQAARPRLRVAAVLPVEGGILLVKQARGGVAYHLLPGGGVESGESIEAALRREVLEETGLESQLVRPLFISDSIDPDGGRHMVQLTFLAKVTGGELRATSSDRAVVGFDVVEPGQLGTLDLRPPMADALRQAAVSSFDIPARYLGALWVTDRTTGNTAGPPIAD